MLKELFLKKGWAGKTISRAETVARLNPLIERHIKLNLLYAAAARDLSDPATREAFDASRKTARANVGKLAETIFSSGGTAYSGVELDPDAAFADLKALTEAETGFREALRDEEKIEHQMRTRAILGVVAASSDERLAMLRDLQRNAG